ncbi:amidohydrolase [Leucobacter sp. L43]|uniref:amidohydrolase n=1 Tax=Leucobacter sp. L43 TaxID=2798040 RepID=UPI001905BF03|nr:amidohydrolase [Leucobacter sp. L43]
MPAFSNDAFDLAITGEYWTPGLKHPQFATIGVRDGAIRAVEQDLIAAHEIRTRARSRVDVDSGFILPGLHDSHVHPIFAGLNAQSCDLSAVETTEEVLAAIFEYAQAHPERDWITGGGWGFHTFGPEGPHRKQLDAVCPHRPAALAVRDVHALWVNSEALRRAGIDRDTPDPEGGYIQRDQDGHATGVLHEAAMALVYDVQAAPSSETLDRALRIGQERLHASGITSWQDALIGSFGGNPDIFDTYIRADAAGTLTGRVNGALFWDPNKGFDQIDELQRRRAQAKGPKFRAHAIKLMQDGIPENHTAALHEPYCSATGAPLTERGASLLEPAELTEVVHLLQDAQFDMHFHAMGDRATTEILDALSTCEPVRGFTPRHQIAHLQSVLPADIPRLAQLDVTANIQALWAAHGEQMDDLCIPLLGAERAEQQFPFKEIVDAGGRLAAGSDWPVSGVSPFEAMFVAIHRQMPGAETNTPVFTPHQRIDLIHILEAYTSGGAWVNRQPRTGQIAVGSAADLTVIDRNPFENDRQTFAQSQTTAVYVQGQIVWE